MDKLLNKVIKSHVLLTVLSVVAVILMVGGVTYALFQIDRKNTTNQTVAIGTLNAEITSINGGIVVSDLYPQSVNDITDSTKKYEFTISNTGTYGVKYEVYLKDATDALLASSSAYSSYKRISSEHYPYINYKLDGKAYNSLSQSQDGEKFIVLTGYLKAGSSENHYLQFFLDNGDTTETGAPNNIAGSVMSLDIYFDGAVFEVENLKDTLLAKANPISITDYDSGNKGEMFTFEHSATAQTEALTDYRYIGANPNNYIDFNDETWRIIGVFTVETESGSKEQLIKIIRDESIGRLPWDMKSDKTYTNEWNTASLKTFLNGEYYNTEGSFITTYYNTSGTAQTLSIPRGLSATARNQIANVKWYLGGSSTYENLGGPDYYAFERGTTTYQNSRTTSIVQKVGLMYPSDYIYTYAKGVDNICYTDGYNCNTGTPANGWLFKNVVQWAVSPGASSVSRAFIVNSNGNVFNLLNVDNTYAVRPTVFLTSDVAIIDGDGSAGNHYKLG